MTTYLVRRLAQSLLSVLVAATVVFMMVRLTGDPVLFFIDDRATPEQIEGIRERLGLADPLYTQYFRYIGGLLQGDLGYSFRHHQDVSALIAQRVLPTIQLVFSSLVLSALTAIPLGVLAAARRGSWVDQVIQVLATVGQAMPIFWLGLLLILHVAVPVAWIPTGGYGGLAHMVLPTFTLAVYLLARLVRLTRSSMLESLGEDYVRTARAKGVARRDLLFKHALRNSAIPVITVLGLQIGTLLSGSIVLENVFAWPAMGTLIVNAVSGRDYPVVQSAVLIFVALFALINLLLDVIYAIVDPRIRYG